MTRILINIVIFQLFSVVFCQVGVEWIRTYNGSLNNNDFGIMSSLDDSGNIYVAGGSSEINTGSDIVIIKYNSNGDLLWKQLYNRAGLSSDGASSLFLDKIGNLYLTGSSEIYPSHSDCITLKYNSTGTLLWESFYDGPSNEDDGGACVKVDSYGQVFVTGSSFGNGTGNDMFTLKCDASGVQQWVCRYNGSANRDDESYGLVIDEAGNVYITGMSYGDSVYFDAILIKYSSSGNQEWIRRYEGREPNYNFTNIIRIDNNGFIYTGGYTGFTGSWNDFLTMKYNSKGDTQWVAIFNSPGNSLDCARSMSIDRNGNIYVTGDCLIGITKTLTLKYNSAGVLQWYSILNDYGSYPTSMDIDSTNSVYVAGNAIITGPYEDIYTIKYNTNGAQIWLQTYNGLSNQNDLGPDIIARENKVFVTGTSTVNGNYDVLTIKYSQLSGIEKNSPVIPENFSLYQNFPNPFNPLTVIKYDLAETGFVVLKVFDIMGSEIKILVNGVLSPGSYEVNFDGSNLSSGIYFYTLNVNEVSISKRMVLDK